MKVTILGLDGPEAGHPYHITSTKVEEYTNVVKSNGGGWNYTVVTRTATSNITFSKGDVKLDEIRTTDRHSFPDNLDKERYWYIYIGLK